MEIHYQDGKRLLEITHTKRAAHELAITLLACSASTTFRGQEYCCKWVLPITLLACLVSTLFHWQERVLPIIILDIIFVLSIYPLTGVFLEVFYHSHCWRFQSLRHITLTRVLLGEMFYQ